MYFKVKSITVLNSESGSASEVWEAIFASNLREPHGR